MRIMAIDYGDQRIGLAVSDLLGMMAGEAWTINEWEMERAALSRDFAALLERETGLTPVLWDERRSSIEAHAILHANGKREKKHRQTVDAVAASLILEGYLGSLH